jgi:hypothetical protein
MPGTVAVDTGVTPQGIMAKAPPARDEQRERRIAQLLAGADDEHQRISGWYCYLEEQVGFPFQAACTRKTAGFVLRMLEQVEVIDLADVDSWEDQVLVTLGGVRDGLDVPLAQLTPLETTDAGTKQAVADWHYWVQRGYQFWTEDDV